LPLADRILLKLLLNNTSRMTGDCHVRFCERLRGETPLDLLGETKTLHRSPQRSTEELNEVKEKPQRTRSEK
ncbi:MAG: hypothetical protein AB1775_11855, partial [Bacteroidota bacterium]